MKIILDPEDSQKLAGQYEQHSPWLLSFAMSVLKNQSDAEDAVHEAFLYVASHYKKYRDLDTDALRGALYTATKCRCINIIHKRNSCENGLKEEICPGDILQAETKLMFDAAILSLPVMEREVFLMHFADGFNLKEISEMMNVNYNTVRKKWCSAKKKLRDQLVENGYE